MMDLQQLKTLQQVKCWKFESAQKEVVQKRSTMEVAEAIVKQAQAARVEFADFRNQEKRRLYQEEFEQGGVKLGKISRINYKIAQLQERMSVFKNEEEIAIKKCTDAQLELQQARDSLMMAQKDVAKYDELSSEMIVDYAKQEEKIQELEYEDFQYSGVLMPSC